MNLRNMNLRKYKFVILIVIGLALLSIFIYLAIKNPWGKDSSEPDDTVTYSTSSPSETPIDKDTYQWPGGEDEPKLISLPTINTEAYIQKVGVDQNKQVAVPDSIYLAGWFVDSSKPGQPGLSIIDGHVTGHFNYAIFKDLDNLKVDDELQVTLGNGTILNYRVIDSKTVSVADSASVLFSQNSKVRSQLNLITCGGNFDANEQSYDQRVIVSAELVN